MASTRCSGRSCGSGRPGSWAGRSSRWCSRFVLLLPLPLLFLSSRVAAELVPTPEGLELFEKRIRPVLVESCYRCHSSSAEKLKGGLHLDSRAGLLKGGDTRPAIVPGDPENSLLLVAIRYGNP